MGDHELADKYFIEQCLRKISTARNFQFKLSFVFTVHSLGWMVAFLTT